MKFSMTGHEIQVTARVGLTVSYQKMILERLPSTDCHIQNIYSQTCP